MTMCLVCCCCKCCTCCRCNCCNSLLLLSGWRLIIVGVEEMLSEVVRSTKVGFEWLMLLFLLLMIFMLLLMEDVVELIDVSCVAGTKICFCCKVRMNVE